MREVTVNCFDQTVHKYTTKGCPQGSICGPVFWDVALEPCLNELETMNEVDGVVAYADDIAIVVSGNSRRDLESRANKTLNVLNLWCHNNKLKISIEKSTYMLMRGNLERNPSIKIGLNNLKRTTSVRYLGVMIDEKQNFHDHIKYACSKALKSMNKIISIGQQKFHLPLKIIQTYHNSILVAIIAYGASVWGHRLNIARNAATINSTQRKILIRLSGAYSTTAQDALLVTLGIHPLHLSVLKRSSCYWLKKNNVIRATEVLRNLVTNREEIGRILMDKWQSSWDASSTGRRVYNFLPNVRERLKLSHIQPNRGMVHFITGHGPYNSTLHRLGILNSPRCACGTEQATPEHIMWECNETNEGAIRLGREVIRERNPYYILRNKDMYKMCEELAQRISTFYKFQYINNNL